MLTLRETIGTFITVALIWAAFVAWWLVLPC